ncbi:MAG: bifunctional oligoribonuclease/PAP phosphatase NrnA [Christensenellales bacterium]
MSNIKNEDKEKLEKMINESHSILVTAHSFPDADAICSIRIMGMLLKKQFNKQCDMFIVGKIGRLLKPFCKDIKTVENVEKSYDLVICLDCTDLTRIGILQNQFKNAKNTVNIDHHYTNTNFAKINCVNVNASSTCEIIYSFCMEYYRGAITPQLAKYAYAGIITDTNGLMSNNINASTYAVIADIVNQGLNIDIIKNYFFKSYSKAKLQLLGKALNTLTFYNNNKIALISISQNDLEECNASFDDTLGIVDYTLNCYLVDTAIAIIEQEKNYFYVSLRSKKTNVAKVADKFGGGGHTNVAAFQHKGEIEDFLIDLIECCANNQMSSIEKS